MLLLEVLDLAERLVLEVGEVLLPLVVEVLQLRVADLDVLRQLSLLDVLPQVVLVLHDVLLQLSHLPHQVLEHMVLQDVAQLLRQELHLGLDQREDQDLFVFVKETVLVHVKNFNEVRCGLDSQEVVDDFLVLVKDQVDIGLVEYSLLSEVSLTDRVPDLLALACTSQLYKTVMIIIIPWVWPLR